jgi:hypothetical protein
LICKDIYRLCGGTTSWKRQAGFVMSLSANHFWCVAIVIIWFKNQSFWSVPPFSLLLDSSLNPRFPIAYLLNPWFPRFFAKCVRNKKKKKYPDIFSFRWINPDLVLTGTHICLLYSLRPH